MYKILVITLLVHLVTSLPNGAPPKACQTMAPFHGGGIEAQNDPNPYTVAPYKTKIAEGTRVRVTLGSRLGNSFKGFMIQARQIGSDQPIGSFVEIPDKSKTIECSRQGDTVTHTDTSERKQLEFDWQSPSGFLGEIVFKATAAQDYATFWVGFESPTIRVVRSSEIGDDDTSSSPQPIRTTTPPYFTTETAGQASKSDDPFYNGCFSSKGCFGAPEGCLKTKDCLAVVATTVRGDRYEFELKGPKEAIYVAVGLSNDNKMGDDSVIECVREGNGAKAYMSRTIGRPNLGVERLPRPNMGIEMINYNVSDGILYCKVRRDVKTDVNGEEYDLINEKYFLLVASGDKLKAGHAGFHTLAYLASGESRYLSDVSEVAGASKLLLRLHGAFMIIAWVGTASMGILLARYFRQTWVGSQMCGKDQWFAWHRLIMITTWTLTMAAFAIIFIELKAWSTESNPHAILGMCTTILCFLQPIGAFFRPHPGTPRRPIFNWVHWLFGNVAHILGIVTIFFAVKLNKAELPEWMDWILVAFVAFHVCMHLIFSILGCMSDRSAERRVTSFPMKDLGGPGRGITHVDRKADAPHAKTRKILLGFYILIIILLVVVLVLVAVLAPIEKTWEDWMNKVMQK